MRPHIHIYMCVFSHHILFLVNFLSAPMQIFIPNTRTQLATDKLTNKIETYCFLFYRSEIYLASLQFRLKFTESSTVHVLPFLFFILHMICSISFCYHRWLIILYLPLSGILLIVVGTSSRYPHDTRNRLILDRVPMGQLCKWNIVFISFSLLSFSRAQDTVCII